MTNSLPAATCPPDLVDLDAQLAGMGNPVTWLASGSSVFGISDAVDRELGYAAWKTTREQDGPTVLLVSARFGDVIEQHGLSDIAVTAQTPDEWFAEREEDFRTDLSFMDPNGARHLDAAKAELEESVLGTPPFEPHSVPHFVRKKHGSKHVRVLVMDAPVGEIVARTGAGGWNEMPHGAAHAIVHTHWWKTHGALPLFVGGDTIELWVPEPPTSPAALKQLAWEQYIYCSDIVDQGTGRVSTLAEALSRSHLWFFWWD